MTMDCLVDWQARSLAEYARRLKHLRLLFTYVLCAFSLCFIGSASGQQPPKQQLPSPKQLQSPKQTLPPKIADNKPKTTVEVVGADDKPDKPVDPKASVDEILDLDIGQLSKVDVVVPSFAVEVTSVTKKESTVGKSPAPVFVITKEMIARSAATTLPEVLRMAPGIHVARIDANKWAISSRGFNGQFSNKLLVLMDGRSIFSPVFSGTRWEQQDIPLENIERVEIVRGPGASTWGANAVNGVINIITRNSRDTTGVLASIGGGNEDELITTLRYGAKNDQGWSYRLHAKHVEHDGGLYPLAPAADDWRNSRLGFRADWTNPCADKSFMFQSEIRDTVDGTNVGDFPVPSPPFLASFPFDTRSRGGHALLRWSEQLSEFSDYSLLGYFDRRSYDSYYSQIEIDIVGLEYQRNWQSDRHNFSLGMGYRGVSDQMTAVNTTSVFSPSSRIANQFSAFFQDEYAIVPDQVFALVGVKLEHNDYSGFEYQPTFRLLKLLDERRAIWGAMSRAVRTPSRAESDLRLNFAFPTGLIATLNGNNELEAENLFSVECGYRAQPNEYFSWDIAGYVNTYSDLILLQPIGLPGGIPPTLPMQYFNSAAASVHGFEINANYQVCRNWALSGWYSHNQAELTDVPSGAFLANSEGFVPHQAFLRSAHRLNCCTDLDMYLRYDHRIPQFNTSSNVNIDLRLNRRLTKQASFSVSLQNLLDADQFEFRGPGLERPTGVQRSVFAQLTWER